jgi:hypothetical protein
MVAPFVSTFCPTGWTPANGSKINVGGPNPPSALYDLIKVNPVWGDGCLSGICWVNKPSLGGNFVRGWEVGQSSDTGRAFGSGQADQFQGHYHSFPYTAFTNTNQGVNIWQGGGGMGYMSSSIGAITDPSYGTVRSGNETRPVNVALLYCIKAVDYNFTGGSSSMTLVEVSTTAAAQLNPGIWGYFTAGDVSFWFGVLVAIIMIIGFKTGGMR